ncbi:MAG: sulfatase [Planctomycetaceae bacterium]|jgi:arylsulfatase A-like enzyme|nr:sulfatase [Planctomycetaceae bacterium]
MKHITFLLPLFLAAAVFAADKPNVLVVLSDDHSAPFVGAYGDKNAVTPNLDKFAAEGVLFRRAYVSCPQCVPARAGIFASRSPVGLGQSRFSAAFPHNVKSFPEYLKDSGYYIGLAGRTYHQEGTGGKGDPVRNEDGTLEYKRFANRYDYAKQTGDRNETIVQLAEFLDSVPKEKPFFLQLCFSDPHRIYDADDRTDTKKPEELILPKWFPDGPELRKDLAGYYNEITRFDESFGQVLAELDKRDLKGNTLVIFQGDNGGATLRGKGTLYEFGVNVPFIVRYPGKAKPGTTLNELISSEDIGPTALAAAGIATPKEFTGRSFLPVLLGQPDAPVREYVFAERGPHGNGLPTNSSNFDLGRTIIGKRYKLIYNATWQIPYHPVDFANQPIWEEVQEAAKNGKVPEPLVPYFTGQPRALFELYDLQNDPDELNNLAGKPEVAEAEQRLKQELVEWQTLERDFIPLAVPPQRPNQQRQNRQNRQR